MSFDSSDGEPVDVYREKRLRARKEHKCDACKETIQRGDLYSSTFMVFEGDPETIRRCLRCDTLFQVLRKKGQADGLQPDVYLNCGETWQDHWEEDPPDDVARLAFMTREEVQAEFASKKASAS